MRAGHQSRWSLSETRKTGLPPGLSIHRRLGRRTKSRATQCTSPLDGTQGGGGNLRASSVADGHRERPHRRRWRWHSATQNTDPRRASTRRVRPLVQRPLWAGGATLRHEGWGRVSHAAIAAVLAMSEATVGERLTAFSLASFASREQRAWPSTRVAAARAGLSRSQYLAARDGLARRGLVIVEAPGGGRGRAPIISLAFAEAGPWFDSDINAELVEAVLSHSRSRGAARVLLATLAAVADRELAVAGFSSDEIRRAASMADSTYRRGRAALLSSGEIALTTAGGGRAITNRWVIRDPRSVNPEPLVAVQTRPAPPARARPLIATARPLTSEHSGAARPAASGGFHERKRGRRTERSGSRKPRSEPDGFGPKGSGIERGFRSKPRSGPDGFHGKGSGIERGFCPKPRSEPDGFARNPATKPRQKPRHPTCAREGNPRTPESEKTPPTPLKGGVTGPRFSSRRSTSPLAGAAGAGRCPWTSTWFVASSGYRASMTGATGSRSASACVTWSTAAFSRSGSNGVELIAVDRAGGLVVAGPIEISAWVKGRFGPVLSASARAVGREVRLADERERAAVGRDGEGGGDHRRAVVNQQEVS